MKQVFMAVFCLIFLFSGVLYAQEWTHSLSLGLNATQGNTETTKINTDYKGGLKWDEAEALFDFAANFGTDNEIRNVENYRAELQYNQNFPFLAGTGIYCFLNASYEIDHMADLERRFLIGPGIGWDPIDKESVSLDLELGGSNLNLKYEDHDAENDTAVRITEEFKWQITETARLWQTAEYLETVDEHDAYVINSELGIETSISEHFNIKSFVSDKYNNAPAFDKDADEYKKKHDLAFTTMLVYTF
jgi:putative salt-induced outer membrane protein YdiY